MSRTWAKWGYHLERLCRSCEVSLIITCRTVSISLGSRKVGQGIKGETDAIGASSLFLIMDHLPGTVTFPIFRDVSELHLPNKILIRK